MNGWYDDKPECLQRDLEALEAARAEGAMWTTGGYPDYPIKRGDKQLELLRILSGAIIQGRGQELGELYAKWARDEILSNGRPA